MGTDGQAFVPQLGSGPVQVLAVGLHFLGFGQLEAVEIAGDPTIGDVDEQEFGAQALGQFRDVRQEALVGLAVFEGNEDFSVHGNVFPSYLNHSSTLSTRNFRFSKTMMPAVSQARALTQAGFANSPILRRSLVNKIRGMTAKESWRLRMTWLRIRRLAVPLSP